MILTQIQICDLFNKRICKRIWKDVMRAGEILTRARIVQHKIGTPVMFEIIAHTR